MKSNYKIFNLKTKRYVSRSRKTTWATKDGVNSAALSEIQESGFRRLGKTDIEIHIFPIEAAIKISLVDFDDEVRKEKAEKLKIKTENAEKRKQKTYYSDLIRHHEELRIACDRKNEEIKKIEKDLQSLSEKIFIEKYGKKADIK